MARDRSSDGELISKWFWKGGTINIVQLQSDRRAALGHEHIV